MVLYYEKLYSQCTHIIGNLVLCYIKRLENGSDPDLSFLSSIREVSGCVFISGNDVKRIPQLLYGLFEVVFLIIMKERVIYPYTSLEMPNPSTMDWKFWIYEISRVRFMHFKIIYCYVFYL